MSLVLNSSGGGSITINEPVTASTLTLNLPASSGTVAVTADAIGSGQTWQNLTASRALGTNYTNTTGKPLLIGVQTTSGIASSIKLIIGGAVTSVSAGSGTGLLAAVNGLIPDGIVYQVVAQSGTPSLSTWYELR